MNGLLKHDIIKEITILSQNIKKKTQRAVKVTEIGNPDEVLNHLEKAIKQYDLYAYLLDERHRDVFLKEIEEMGFSKSSLDTLIKKGYLEKYDAEIERDPFANRIFEKEDNRQLTHDQQIAFDAIKEKIDANEERTFYYMV